MKRKKIFDLIILLLTFTFIFLSISDFISTRQTLKEHEEDKRQIKINYLIETVDSAIIEVFNVAQHAVSISNEVKINKDNFEPIQDFYIELYKNLMVLENKIETLYTFYDPSLNLGSETPYVCILRDEEENPMVFFNTDKNSPEYKYYDQDWYTSAKNSEDFVWTDPYFEDTTGRLLISGVQKITDSKGNFTGVTGIDISLDKIENIFNKLPNDDINSSFVITNDGTYIYSSDNKTINNENEVIEKLQSKLSINKSSYNPTYILKTEDTGFDFNYYYHNLPYSNWYVIIEEDIKSLKGAFKKSGMEDVLILILGLFIVVIMYIQVRLRAGAEKMVYNYAFINNPTGLKNRNYLKKNVSKIIEKLNNSDKMSAFLFVDVDNFKDVNDKFGHVFGDKFLKGMARRIDLHAGENSEVFSLGGDEFLIIISEKDSKEDIENYTAEILKSISCPLYIENKRFDSITVSIGVAVVGENGNNYSDLLNNSDIAMYNAKNSGKNNYKFYKKNL